MTLYKQVDIVRDAECVLLNQLVLWHRNMRYVCYATASFVHQHTHRSQYNGIAYISNECQLELYPTNHGPYHKGSA